MERILKQKLKGGVFSNVSSSRSRMMSLIRGKNNKSTELRLRMAFVKAGVKGWSLHPADVLGKPDIFFAKKRVAIFVDGCFWHGCKSCGHIPKTRSAFWKTKIDRNQARAKFIKSNLRHQSIKVIRIWEHSLNKTTEIKKLIQDILKVV